MDYKYLFGPVQSRRLGISLGVDLIPSKTCSFDCIYCECGRTTEKTLKRDIYIDFKDIIAELDHYLSARPKLDFITLAGSGEPTLNKNIGELILFIKKNYPLYKIALLTNSSLFTDDKFLKELLDVDLVLPSLDAGSQNIFEKINKPSAGLMLEDIVLGLAKFKKIFKGKMWLEVFIVPGLNDFIDELELIKENIKKINPDKVQLNTLDRPGTDSNLKPESVDKLKSIAEFFKDFNVEIIARKRILKLIDGADVNYKADILATLKRRPCTLDDVSILIGQNKIETLLILEQLIKDDRIKTTEVKGMEFYVVKS